MPNLPASVIRDCARASATAPTPGSTGAVPNGRVSWPSPRVVSSTKSTGSTMSFWWGATPSPSASAPTQIP